MPGLKTGEVTGVVSGLVNGVRKTYRLRGVRSPISLVNGFEGRKFPRSCKTISWVKREEGDLTASYTFGIALGFWKDGY